MEFESYDSLPSSLGCALACKYFDFALPILFGTDQPFKSILLQEKTDDPKNAIPKLSVDGSAVIRGPLAVLSFLAQQLVPSTNNKDMLLAETLQWIFFCHQHDYCIDKPNQLTLVDDHLYTRTFLTAPTLCVDDIILYASIYNWMVNASVQERKTYCNILRWFDCVQYSEGITEQLKEFKIFSVDEDTSDNQLPEQLAALKIQESQNESKGSKASNKKRKEHTSLKSKHEAVENKRPVDDVTRLEVRVGLIKSIKRHPNAEKLYIEEIDIGEEKPRHIVSGLVGFITEEQLLGQKCLVVANMKPKKFRGEVSHGMILCATSSDKSRIEFLRPPAEVPIGEMLKWEGLEGIPDVVMDAKAKDPFVATQPHFKTSEDFVAYYKEFPFTTSAGVCRCDSIAGGTIS